MQEKNKKIVICSKNKAKNDAVNNVLKEFLKDYELISLNTNSNVSETPITDEEGITGCMNRIKDAMNQVNDADMYVAMEGILMAIDNKSFLCGWTVVYDKKYDEYYYGCSARIRVPDEIINKVDKDKRLSDIVAEYMGCDETEVANYGTNGMLTHGAYTRTDEFTDSVLCAISSKYNKINGDK